MCRLPAVLALALLSASPARAATRRYLVDAQHPHAADTNAGDAERPLKTIAAAAKLAEPGDTVVVKAGLYREAVPLRRSGTPGAPITFLAEPKGSVVISGADVIAGWARLPGDAPIYRVAWPHQFAVNHRNGKAIEHHPHQNPVWGRAEQVIVDGRQLIPVGTFDALRKAWAERPQPAKPTTPPDALRPETWAGMFAVDTSKKELYLWLADGSDPNAHAVEAATRGLVMGVNPWQLRQGIGHVHVRGFVFRYGASWCQRGIVWLHGRHNVLEDCLIEDASGGGVRVAGAMRRCIIRRCGHVGGGAGGDGFLNEDSLWLRNCWKPIKRGWDAGGFKMAKTDGGVFRRCVFRRNGGPGLWLDIHVRNVLITECVFEENEQSGLFIEISRDITAMRNLAVGNGTGVVQAPGKVGWGTAGIKVAESMNCVLAFNTCVHNKNGIALREQGPRTLKTDDFGEVPYHNTRHVIVGNVCAWNKEYQMGLWYDNSFFGWHPSEKRKFKTEAAYEADLETQAKPKYDPSQQAMLIDRNLYCAGEGQGLALYGVPWRPKHAKCTTLDAFRAKTGFDAHSRVGDPGLVSPDGRDFRPARHGAAWRMQAGWLLAPKSVDEWVKALLTPATQP